ncbi:nucleolar complex protein 2 homolog [Parasteatoda tepidariorum]|uniref:nucleolar complex protein 2 homolog n=1 Tax=Parasteatoda tepidariorum TaxID=114398 RepID=UPI00077FC08F|nr:nucleolar complex protein 2 homolog [Parasteatoda tepidariorum]
MSGSESELEELSDHVASLKRLKSKDPEFYEFLKTNDKDLLNFRESESDDHDSENNEVKEDDNDEIEEEALQESISVNKLEYIKENIRENPSVKLCKALITAFRTAVHQADGSNEKANMKNSELFNEVIKLCLIELYPALCSVLKLSKEESKKKKDPTQSKLWKKMMMPIKSYLIDLLKLFSIMNNSHITTLLLKHTVHLIPFYAVFIKLARNLVKKMIVLWSGEEETVRVLSLIIIVRLTRTFSKEYLNQVLKEMYFAYIKNTKFTSPTTWPMINFMKRSLTEVYSLNAEIAYEHSFIYIRQLCIHLRNAITTKKKEAFQTVYNWQYVHCLMHWSHLLCRLYELDAIKTLIYPLVQTIVGTLNLIPTARYIPLRIHLVKILMFISESTGTFIPTLPFILEILTIIDFNKKSNFSIKPLEFSCALKVTKSQLVEAGFKDASLNEVCNLLMEYLKIYSHTIGFPELALPAVLQIKSFMKLCRVPKYNQQLKAILIKIEENSFFISEKRRLVHFQLNDNQEIKRWEEDVLKSSTPLLRDLKDNKPATDEVQSKKKTVADEVSPKKRKVTEVSQKKKKVTDEVSQRKKKLVNGVSQKKRKVTDEVLHKKKRKLLK